MVTEEYAVLDRSGRLQLRDRVKLNLEPDHIEVRNGHR
jgi:putative ABC transport system ATP-binding protein